MCVEGGEGPVRVVPRTTRTDLTSPSRLPFPTNPALPATRPPAFGSRVPGFQLTEKDTSSKLDMLLKRNLFTLALAGSSHPPSQAPCGRTLA